MIDALDPADALLTIKVVDAQATAPLISVPDETAVPDMIEVPNPDCKLPEDAVVISKDQHTALLDAQAAGQVIAADRDGFPVCKRSRVHEGRKSAGTPALEILCELAQYRRSNRAALARSGIDREQRIALPAILKKRLSHCARNWRNIEGGALRWLLFRHQAMTLRATSQRLTCSRVMMLMLRLNFRILI